MNRIICVASFQSRFLQRRYYFIVRRLAKILRNFEASHPNSKIKLLTTDESQSATKRQEYEKKRRNREKLATSRQATFVIIEKPTRGRHPRAAFHLLLFTSISYIYIYPYFLFLFLFSTLLLGSRGFYTSQPSRIRENVFTALQRLRRVSRELSTCTFGVPAMIQN